VPVWSNQQIMPGLSVVLLADGGKRVSAGVHYLIGEEAFAEIRNWDNHWREIEMLISSAVDGVLIRTRNKVLTGIDEVGKHRHVAGRRCWHDAADAARFRQVRDSTRAVHIVDQRPAPDIGQATHHLDV